MGRESRVERERNCANCGRSWWFTARELREHSDLCTRAVEAGLILPGLDRPDLGLVDPRGEKL